MKEKIKKEKYANFRGVEVIQVLKISVNEGDGIVGDPIYREVYYVTMDGKLIGRESSEPLRKFANEG